MRRKRIKRKHIKRQTKDNDTLVAWDVDNECWQDIRVSTINYWIGLPDE